MPAFTLYVMSGLVVVIVGLTLLLRDEPPVTPAPSRVTAPAERSPRHRIRRRRAADQAAAPSGTHPG